MTFYVFQTLLFAGLLNAAILMLAFPQLPIKNRRPHILLGILVLLIALSFVSFGLVPRMRRLIDGFNLSHLPVNFLIGPIFLLLVKSIFSKDAHWKQKYLLHFIPGILDILLITALS
ncbi:MAG: hypothetical protein AAF242_06485, partial [Bacteroidota bacterium]